MRYSASAAGVICGIRGQNFFAHCAKKSLLRNKNSHNKGE